MTVINHIVIFPTHVFLVTNKKIHQSKFPCLFKAVVIIATSQCIDSKCGIACSDACCLELQTCIYMFSLNMIFKELFNLCVLSNNFAHFNNRFLKLILHFNNEQQDFFKELTP